VITLNVALGGMKGITLVQAFQYWAKMFAISLPIFVLLSVYGGYGTHLAGNGPVESRPASVARAELPAKAPADATWLAPFGPLTTKAAKAAAAALPADQQKRYLEEHERPFSLLYTYSLIIALVCGTAGLPHILVRFYTNPDGVAAKRTTMWVMILIGIFYVFPPVFGVIGRNLMPELYSGIGVSGTDGIVLKLPTLLREKYGVLGSILSGVTCAGAFAAFMSTFSGLLVSMTGAVAHDVYGRILRPNSTPAQRMAMFKVSAVVVGAVAIFLGTLVENFEINFMVGQAFAIAAASYFPLLFMSVWWRGMTMKGAATGMLTGGLLALVGISLTSWTTFITAQGAKFKALNVAEPGWFQALKGVSLTEFWAAHPLMRILCEQPAIWAVPLAMILMVVVSKLTKKDIPSDARMKMLVLHAPEQLGLKQEYIQDHHAAH
jgi:cation/acetate symporter